MIYIDGFLYFIEIIYFLVIFVGCFFLYHSMQNKIDALKAECNSLREEVDVLNERMVTVLNFKDKK